MIHRLCGVTIWAVVGLLLTGLTVGCRDVSVGLDQSKPAEVVWKPVGTWSGHGRGQTESFESGSGSFRVRWQTTNEAPAGRGRFQLTLNSSISGRPLQVIVDETGARQDVTYVRDDPRVFFAVVESDNVDWSFSIDEAVTR